MFKYLLASASQEHNLVGHRIPLMLEAAFLQKRELSVQDSKTTVKDEPQTSRPHTFGWQKRSSDVPKHACKLDVQVQDDHLGGGPNVQN